MIENVCELDDLSILFHVSSSPTVCLGLRCSTDSIGLAAASSFCRKGKEYASTRTNLEYRKEWPPPRRGAQGAIKNCGSDLNAGCLSSAKRPSGPQSSAIQQ